MARMEPGFGLLLIDERFSPSSETAQGSGTRDSSYSEAGPVPGVPAADTVGSPWLPRISQAQTLDVETIVTRGGYPGVDAASVAVRASGSSAEGDWQGWDDPVTVRQWTAPPEGYSGTANADNITACVVEATQRLLVVQCGTGGLDPQATIYDPRSDTWTTASTFSGLATELPISLVYDREEERAILYLGYGPAGSHDTLALYSENNGLSWAFYSRGLYDTETLVGDTRVTTAAAPRRAWCQIRCGTGLDQFASLDHGVTWQLVESVSGTVAGNTAQVVALKSGAYLVVYVAVTSLNFVSRKLGSATAAFSDAPSVTIDSVDDHLTVAVAVDADGIVYAYSTEYTETGRITAWRSRDEGATWERYTWAVADTDATNYPLLQVACAAAGSVHLLHLIQGDASIPDCWGNLVCGGYTNVEAGVGSTALTGSRLERIGFGAYAGAAGIVFTGGVAWLPFGDPDDMGLVKATAGTFAFDFTSGVGMTVETTSGAVTWTAFSGAADVACGEAWVACSVGSALTGTPDVQIAGIKADAAEAQYYGWTLYITAGTTWRILDEHGATTTDVTVEAGAGYHLRWVTTQSGKLSLFMRKQGAALWTVAVDKLQLTAGGVATDDSSAFGHGSNSTGTSLWLYFCHAPDADWFYGLEDVGDLQDVPDDGGHLGLAFGRSLSIDPYPCPPAGAPDDGGDCPRIAARGGPARVTETTQIPVAHTHPARAVYPSVSALPAVYWESEDTSEQRRVWDLGQYGWLGGAFGLVVLGGYGRQVELAYDDLSTGWTVAATLDLSLSGGTALNSAIAGSSLIPRAGGATLSRYLGEGELVGGYGICSAGGGFVGRKIVRQSAGWFDSSSSQPVRIDLEGVDGTEDTAGTVDLVAPSGVLVVYPTGSTIRRYWRTRWASGQTTPGSVYRAGTLGLGRIVGLGAQPDWTWRAGLDLSREVVRDRGGAAVEVRQLAAPRETWAYGWASGVALANLRSSTTPDHVASSSGRPIGVTDDAWHVIRGVLEHELQSGARTCVVLPQLPAATGTVLDPDLWLYGRVMMDSTGASGVDGREGTDAHLRFDGLTVESLGRRS